MELLRLSLQVLQHLDAKAIELVLQKSIGVLHEVDGTGLDLRRRLVGDLRLGLVLYHVLVQGLFFLILVGRSLRILLLDGLLFIS